MVANNIGVAVAYQIGHSLLPCYSFLNIQRELYNPERERERERERDNSKFFLGVFLGCMCNTFDFLW
jgi:hypothetical protein